MTTPNLHQSRRPNTYVYPGEANTDVCVCVCRGEKDMMTYFTKSVRMWGEWDATSGVMVLTHLGTGSLTLDTVSGARKTELVVRNGWALNKMRVLQPFLAQRTLERGRVVVGGGGGGGRGSRRRVGQRYGRGGRRQGHRRCAAVHRRGAGRAVGAAATGRRGVCGACARTAAAAAVSSWPAAAAATGPTAVTPAAGIAATATGRPCAASRPTAVGLARRYSCRADVPATRRSASAGRTAACKTKIVSTTKHNTIIGYFYTVVYSKGST